MVGLVSGGAAYDGGQLQKLFPLKTLFQSLAQLNPFSQPDASTVDNNAPVNVTVVALTDVAVQINMANQRYNNLATAFNTLVGQYNALKNQVASMTTMTNNLQLAGAT